MSDWISCDNGVRMAGRVAEDIVQCAQQAIAEHGEFRLVLAGGTTPLACYRLLVEQGVERGDWRLFYGDERCLPEDHHDRNHRLVQATGLCDGVAAHHVMAAELGGAQAAAGYAKLIAGLLPFDLVLLGMGEDGHTASLFPGHELGDRPDAPLALAVVDSPKPPPERVSLSLRALRQCHHMIAMISGEGKRNALQRWQAGVALPIARVTDCKQARLYVEQSLLEGAAC